MNLGATYIKVEHMTGWSKDFSIKLSVPFGESGESISEKLKKESESSSKLLYEANFPGTTEPDVPDGLVWYPHEPTWQNIAKGRKDFGLQNFSLNVNYEDDFGVNAGLKVSVQKSGLELGGKFEDHESTVWRIVGQFKRNQ